MGYAKLRRSSFCSVVRLELAQPASLLRTVFGMTPLLRSHHPTTFRRIKVEAKEVVEKTVREIVCLCRLYNSESIKSLVSSCWGFESQRVSKVHPNPHHRLAACRTLSPQPRKLSKPFMLRTGSYEALNGLASRSHHSANPRCLQCPWRCWQLPLKPQACAVV